MYLSHGSAALLVQAFSSFSVEPVAEAQELVLELALELVLELEWDPR